MLRLMTRFAIVTAAFCAVPLASAAGGFGKAPKLGEKAPAFALAAIDGRHVTLARELERGPLVLVLLRGWPSYQSPLCARQFADFLDRAADLEKAGARVVWVYPGPADQLQQRAAEFTAGRTLPANFRVTIDPDYEFTKAYGLRWDESNETAYPATFVIDRKAVVRFERISIGYDRRARATDVLEALAALAR
jgi:peroxiredoxin Q/BCP